jgi:hypothetical protein
MFDRDFVKVIRDKINSNLQSLAEELGVSIDVGNASFTENNIRFKLEVAKVSNGTAITPEVEQWKKYAKMFGLDPAAFGKTFTYGGNQFRIAGLATRRGKFPVLADRVPDGKKFKFPIEVAKSNFPVH